MVSARRILPARTDAAFGKRERTVYIEVMPTEIVRESLHAPIRPTRIGVVLLGLTGVFFIAAGGLLWWRHGAAVFNDYVIAALAWCF